MPEGLWFHQRRAIDAVTVTMEFSDGTYTLLSNYFKNEDCEKRILIQEPTGEFTCFSGTLLAIPTRDEDLVGSWIGDMTIVNLYDIERGHAVAMKVPACDLELRRRSREADNFYLYQVNL